MADPAPTGTVVPAPQGGSATPEFKVPDGKVLVDSQDHQSWQRQREQLAGLTRFHGEATKRGFKTADDWGRYDRFSGSLKNKGLTLDQVSALLDGGMEAPAEEKSSGGLDMAAIKKFLADEGYVSKGELDKREALMSARMSHKEAMAAEQKLMEKHLAELYGENASDFSKAQIKALLSQTADSRRGFYPEGHPLQQEAFAAHDEKSLSAIVAEIKKMQADSEGAALAAKGAAVNSGAKPVAGSGGSKQPTKPQDKDDDDAPIGSPEHRKKVERYAASLAAKRGYGPTSAAGQ